MYTIKIKDNGETTKKTIEKTPHESEFRIEDKNGKITDIGWIRITKNGTLNISRIK